MILTRRQTDYASGLIILLTILAGILIYADLPAHFAIHFSASGTPDNFVPPIVGITLMPAIMLTTLIFLRYTPTLDPTADLAVLRVTTLATMALLGAVHGIVLAFNVGYPVNMNLVLPGVVIWTIAVMGYAFYADLR